MVYSSDITKASTKSQDKELPPVMSTQEFNPEDHQDTEIHPSHMPPLDRTAEVPVTHSDTVHGEDNWRGVQEVYHGPAVYPAPEQTDEVLTGRKTIDEVRGEVAAKRKLGHLPTLVGLGLAGVAASVAVFMGINGDSDKAPEKAPEVSAPVDPTPTETVPQTPELKPLPSFNVSAEKHSNPVDAVTALEELRLKFICGDIPSYDDHYQRDKSLGYDEYLDIYISAIFGDLDRSDPIIVRTLELQSRYDMYNSNLAQDKRSERYRLTLKNLRVTKQDGNTISYDPSYKVNTETIPEDYRSPSLDASDEEDNHIVTLTVGEHRGDWVVKSTQSVS